MIQLLFLLLPVFARYLNSEQIDMGTSKAVIFMNSLNESQKRNVIFPFDEMNRYEWHYLPASVVARDGINISKMTQDQKNKLFALMQSYLSDRVWRDFNGNFGRDLLREHYQNSPHHK